MTMQENKKLEDESFIPEVVQRRKKLGGEH
jgi:hypothetical protein